MRVFMSGAGSVYAAPEPDYWRAALGQAISVSTISHRLAEHLRRQRSPPFALRS